MVTEIHIDFETRSVCDLRKVGAYRYSEDPSTDVLCLAYGINDRMPELWIPANKKPPQLLFHAMSLGEYRMNAWNVEFEIAIWENICVRRYGWPAVPLENWHDTMARAAAMSYPLSLEAAAAVLGTEKKAPEGKQLINKLCRPHKGRFREPEDYPEDFLRLYDYCLQDVVVEWQLKELLPPLTAKEYRVWRHCLDMNRRGIPIDMAEVNAVHYQVDRMKDRLNSKMPWLTKGAVVSATQIGALTKWVANRLGRKIKSLDRAAIGHLLDEDNLDPLVRDVLEIRLQVSKSSTAKLAQAQAQVCTDSTLKNSYVYHGAGTGRYAGRGMQPQNLPARGAKLHDPDAVINDFIHLDIKMLDFHYPVMETASALLRALIKAPRGFKFLVGDFSSIEAIVTPWVAQENLLLNSIRAGQDLYVFTAARMFNTLYENVTPSKRDAGKVTTLACGFGGGFAALLRMAEAYGISMTEEQARGTVYLFRDGRPDLVQCWWAFYRAARAAIEMAQPIVPVEGALPGLNFRKTGDSLQLTLPSGRRINYPGAFLDYEESPRGSRNLTVFYYRQDPVTRVWGPHRMTGGNFFQNAVQGIARDMLTESQLNLESRGYPIFMSTHDECGAMVPDTPAYTLENFLKIMATPPAWAADFPLKANGWEGYRYRK